METSRRIQQSIIITAIIILGIALGCNRDAGVRSQNVLQPELTVIPERVADQVEEINGVRSLIFDPANEYTIWKIGNLVKEYPIATIINRFMDSGFCFDASNSFIMARESMGGIEEFSTITLAFAGNENERVIYIGVAESSRAEKLIIDAVEYRFGKDAGSNGFESILENVWVRQVDQSLLSVFNLSKASSSLFGEWLRCWGKRTLLAGVGVAVRCAISGPGYAHCLAGGLIGASVVTSISCAFSVLAN